MIPDDKNKMLQIFEKDMPPLKKNIRKLWLKKN